jgi:hypothetical protein
MPKLTFNLEEEEGEGVAGEEDVIVLDLLSKYGEGLAQQILNQELAWGSFSTK